MTKKDIDDDAFQSLVKNKDWICIGDFSGNYVYWNKKTGSLALSLEGSSSQEYELYET